MRGLPDLVRITPEARAALRSARLPFPVVLFLLAVIVPINFSAGPLVMTTLRLFLLIMVVPLLVQLLRGRFGRIFPTDILFLLHICWAALALLINNPNQMVQQIGSVGVEFIGGYLVGRAYIRSAEDFAALCRWLVVLVCLSIPFALFETVTGRPLAIEILNRLPGTFTVDNVQMEKRLGLDRVQFTFAHPIHYGLFCSVAFSLGFVAMKNVTSNGLRWISSICVAAAGFLALSSGALLAVILQIALILWATAFNRILWRWWLLVGLFGLGYVVVDLLSNRTPVAVFMSYATFSSHNAYWRGLIFEWGMKAVWGNPFFGIGLQDWARPAFMVSSSVDNFWLLMAMRYGIPGFLLLVIGYVLIMFHVMRRNFEDDAMLAQIRRAWVFTFLGLSFTLCTVHVWTNIYSFVMFLFGAGVWLITVNSSSAPAEGPAAPGRGAAERSGGRPAAAAASASAALPGSEPAPPATPQARTSPYTRFRTGHVRATPHPRGHPPGG